MSEIPSTNVVWSPIPGSQTLALLSPAKVTLYEGTRGPGKTDCQLMRFRMRVGMGYGQHWRGIIFDREYKNLDDIVSKSQRWFPRFNDGAKFNRSKADYRWVWPTGEELLFRVMETSKEYENYHGHEYPFIGWNELTKWKDSSCFDVMMSCNRSSFVSDGLIPPIPLEVFATTNPHGVGHTWVKRRFIDPAPTGVIVEKTQEVIKPGTESEKVKVSLTQVALHGHWSENPFLDPAYIAEMQSSSLDPAKKAAWLDGNWNVIGGTALADVWCSRTVVPRFVVPPSWRIDRAYDDGSAKPFSVGWYARANGETATIYQGDRVISFTPPAGSIVQIAEWYGTTELGSNKGLRLAPTEIARGILKREEALRENGWISTPVYPGPADNAIWTRPQVDQLSVAEIMEKEGVTWERSDKSPGSRKNGLVLMRMLLDNTMRRNGDPGLFFMNNCKAAIMLLPILPFDEDDPDDVDTDAEDHCYDQTRYRVMAAPSILTSNVHLGHV